RTPHGGAPEASTWSTRSAASMNDVDTDQHRQTLATEEGPTHTDHVHNAALRWIHPVTGLGKHLQEQSCG
ncbi:hypothetical protein, partial [Ornithinimicrobium cavernae]|uniref:hypothetical protein n=1 Tax=Ornithinimicrobium cavernae TaxID=2666047 RepID=UPI001F373FC0